ncbi:unnamed protein product [Ambrosiozyma monospora]|uniref:Unnamed protein product n=1 Tax=Ambrosiozyma monospora TaxID=43982 RepID=A0A9W7DJJ9_AMBMO|nr:unnamed protein product [Ambrosiozyma monospora]
MSQPPQLDISQLSNATVPLPGLNPLKEEKASSFWSSNPLYSFVNNVSTTITSHRQSLDLINPGTMENINKEVSRDVFLNQLSFQGLRADISKTFCFKPDTFQVSHSFSVGGQAQPYSFNAVLGNDSTFFQGSIDSEYSLTGRLNHAWDKHIISKVTLQLAEQQSMCQLEHDYEASDFSLNFKALNPDVFGKSLHGVYVGSILQSLTPKLSVGIESVYSAMQPGGAVGDAGISLYGRYNNKNWIASAQFLNAGQFIGSFWKRLAPNVEAGVETTISAVRIQTICLQRSNQL